MIRSTIYSGITGSLRCRHPAKIPPPLSRNPRDATIQFRDNRRWGRCRALLRGRSHGRHVHRPSLDRWLALTGISFGSVLSGLLFGDRAARYVVVVWSGIDVLINFLRVVRGAVVPVVVVWSGVDVLTNFLPVVGGAAVCVVTILYGVDVLSMA